MPVASSSSSFDKKRLERDRDFLGKTDADETAGRDGVAVADEADGLLRADDLSAVRWPQGMESMWFAGLLTAPHSQAQ